MKCIVNRHMVMICLTIGFIGIITSVNDVSAARISTSDQGYGVVLSDGSQAYHANIGACEDSSSSICGNSYPWPHFLYDTSRGNTAIVTDYFDNWNGTPAGFQGMSNCGSWWNNGTDAQRAAVDAHVYTGKVYDYLSSTFGRNSYDNKGSWMPSLIETPGCENRLAVSWGDYIGICTVDPNNLNKPVRASGLIDMVAHEWGHGVTATAPIRYQNGYQGDLTYSGESGALNESFSDALGIAVKHHYNGNGGPVDWIFGRNHCVGHKGIRNLADPRDPYMHKMQPDYYKGADWCNCAVHTDSGVPNKMFYLFSQGGTHPVSGITVQGVGIEKAMKILYDANMYYWPSNATFYQAMLGMIGAADGFGGCFSFGWEPYEAQQVMLAWAAVGVGNTLALRKSGDGIGTGTVTHSSVYIPYAINNTINSVNDVPTGYQFRYVYPPYDLVTLTAVPSWNSYFAGWQGDCDSVSGTTCTVSMSGARNVTALFNYDSYYDDGG